MDVNARDHLGRNIGDVVLSVFVGDGLKTAEQFKSFYPCPEVRNNIFDMISFLKEIGVKISSFLLEREEGEEEEEPMQKKVKIWEVSPEMKEMLSKNAAMYCKIGGVEYYPEMDGMIESISIRAFEAIFTCAFDYTEHRRSCVMSEGDVINGMLSLFK